MKLRKKLVLVIGLAVCTVFLLACFLLTGYLLRILTQESVQMQTYELEQSADRMNTLVERAYETAASIAADSSVQHIVAETDVSPMEYLVNQKELEYQLSMHINVNPNFAAVFVIGENGVQYSNSDQYVQYSLREEEWFDAALRSSEPFFLSDQFVFFNARGRNYESVISLVIPIYNIYNGTEQLGHVAVCIRLNAFSELLPAQSTFTTACGVYNRDGQAVVGYGDYPQGYPSGENAASGRHLLSAPLSFGGWRIACLVSEPLLFQTAAVPMLVILVGMVIIVVGLVVFLRAVSGQLLAPMNQLIEGTERIGAGDFTKRIEVNTKDEFHALAQAFNSMQDNIQRYIRQRVEYEQHIKDMEIQRLMLQINPHFIYNTLDSIVFMAQIAQQKNIVEFTRSFISLLHNTLLISDDPGFTTVETELANIRHYLVLQQYRYPNKIDVVYDVDPQAAFCRIPGLFLLTLVENAIFHGICPKEGKGTLRISVHCSDDLLTLAVTDDGVGMPDEKILMLFNEEQGAGHRVHRIGLNNIQQRIHQLYGEAYGLSIESQLGEGTCATVRLPHEKGQTQKE